MSNIPDSIKAKAEENDQSFIDLWHNISANVRDALYARAHKAGSNAVGLTWAMEEVEAAYPWIPEGNERFSTAMSGLSYGCGVRLWDVAFIDKDGNTVDAQVARKAIEDDDTEAQSNIYMTWPLLKKWVWPLRRSEHLFPDEPCRFGAVRRFDVHAGIDLFCELGQEVVAVEAGEVIGIETFTGPNSRPRKTPWWNETFIVLVRGESGVVAYGEVQPRVQVGDRVKAGQLVAVVEKPVLRAFKGRPMVMLHLELYTEDTTETTTWGADPTPPAERVRPPNLLDPTGFLEEASHDPKWFDIGKYDGTSFRDPTAEAKASRWWTKWGGESPPRED